MTTLPPGGSPVAPVRVDEVARWHRLHPLSPLVRAGSRLWTILIIVGVVLFADRHETSDLITNLVIFGLALASGLVSWLVTRWQVADGVLRIDTGLIRRESRRFPLSQVQAIDVVQTGLARVLRLAALRLRMASADSSGGTLAYLPLADAERLRAQFLATARALSAMAPGTARGAGAPAAGAEAAAGSPEGAVDPGRVLFRVDARRLAAGITLSLAGAIAAIVIVVTAGIETLTGVSASIAPYLPYTLAIVLAVWRQFNVEYGATVTATPEGLLLRSGLIQTANLTIRPGRVQAVRLVEPLIWRAFGWYRLEVDVAGPRRRRASRPESARLRALIPVGSHAQVEQMIVELLGTRPKQLRRAPRKARWKAPLTYHFLGWNLDDHYVVAARGRVCRKTTWVPLEKAQSIRWVQGPVQRRLGLASVRLDVAGRLVRASILDRDAAEAREILGQLPDLARNARTARRLCATGEVSWPVRSARSLAGGV